MSNVPIAVFDVNIYISAIIFGGNPRQCLELARKNQIELVSSRAIMLQLATKLYQKFHWRQTEVEDVVRGITYFATLVSPSISLTVVKADPSDNHILECALEAKADYLVSGDKKHLLKLKVFGQTVILAAKPFLDLFYRRHQN